MDKTRHLRDGPNLALGTSRTEETARRQTQPNPENLENLENPAHENPKKLEIHRRLW